MTPSLLAQALIEVTDRKSDVEVDAVVSRLVAYLRERNKLSMLPKVLEEVERQLLRRTAAKETQVLVASEADYARHEEAICKALAELGAEGDADTVVDPTLVGGFAVSHKGERIDYTYKRNLLNLYQTLLHV